VLVKPEEPTWHLGILACSCGDASGFIDEGDDAGRIEVKDWIEQHRKECPNG
jgi:hypothetical protein